jgi:hypothetical protein
MKSSEKFSRIKVDKSPTIPSESLLSLLVSVHPSSKKNEFPSFLSKYEGPSHGSNQADFPIERDLARDLFRPVQDDFTN